MQPSAASAPTSTTTTHQQEPSAGHNNDDIVQPCRLHPATADSQLPASFYEAVATDRLLKLRPLFHDKTKHRYHRLRIRRFGLRPPPLSNDSTSHTTTNFSAERTLKSHCPSLRYHQPLLQRLQSLATIAALSLGHLLPCSRPALSDHMSAPPSFTTALNPQAYVGTFFYQICSNCCSSLSATSAVAKRSPVAATVVALAPTAASQQPRLLLLPNYSSISAPVVVSQSCRPIPSAVGSSFSEAPSPGSLL
ncbi:hypothetical protein BHE74_00029601 [Ensete ventricosum]|nr:hypothetical protein BHE74_00029601 [Ensete ventricosum]